MFCLLAGATLAAAGLSAATCVIVWQSLLLGTSIGIAVGLAVPLPKEVIPYPGSRYVPLGLGRVRKPVPSLAALGIWPVRRMFSMLRPQTLARAALPLMIMMPVGTQAAAGMLVMGQLLALMALAFLVMSVLSVRQTARRWLKPLPLSLSRLSILVTARSLAFMAVIVGVIVWLRWVGRS